ncbi:hypothetical protein AWC38_SpisGene1770 [Stylophora pistillata]|uniref:Uncharacterized protein n=1 Tax=Stylophora pistillata TaxID=50429 RepID=A0A2B4SVE6_STYPI|nr:hypothetical protein AWC38_SpisGene1770 [Stylophora pistillata]
MTGKGQAHNDVIEQASAEAKVAEETVKNFHVADEMKAAVRSFEELAIRNGRHSIIKDAKKYAEELDLQLLLNFPYAVAVSDGKEVEAKKVKQAIYKARQREIQAKVTEERWQGKLIKNRWDYEKVKLEECFELLSSWKNTPTHTIARVQELYQQLLPTRVYYNRKRKSQVTDEKCRLCGDSLENVQHILSGYFLFFACVLDCLNHCVIVVISFNRCHGWLRFAAQPKLLIFTLDIETFVLQIYNNGYWVGDFCRLSEWNNCPSRTIAGLVELYEQLLPTRVYMSQKTHSSGEGEVRCNLCGKAPESVAHILSGCSALAQSDAALKVPFYELLYDEGVIDEIPPWHSPDKPKPVYESENVKAYWDVLIYADQQEVTCNRVDARIVNHMCKRVVMQEMSCPWAINNRTRKDEEKTLKYGPLRWKRRQQFPGYEVK